MTLNSDIMFKEKLTLSFKYDMKNFVNFHPTTEKSTNVTLMGYFCSNYISCIFHDTKQWRKFWIKRDLVISKMTWEIRWTFIRALKVWKIVHWWDLLSKGYNISARKISEELCVMALKGDAKLKRKLTCGLKNDIRNLVNFHASSRKSENLHFHGLLLSKVMSHDTEEWCKVWRKTNSCFQKWHEEFGEF